MSPISTCPRCRLQVSLPERTSPAARVKCPLCSAEYSLQEALDQVPPPLIVLDHGAGPSGAVEAAAMSGAAVGAALDAGSTGALPEVEFPDDHLTDIEGEGAEGLAHFADRDGIDDGMEEGGIEGGIDGVDEDDVEGRLALGDETPDESGAMIGGPLRREADDFELSHGAASASRAASDRRDRLDHRGSGFAEMIKAVLGAVIGLAIGYYILLWLGRDPIQLKPFLHTYLPDWLVP